MRRLTWRATIAAACVLVLLAAAVLAALLVWGLPHEHINLFIDGEAVDIPPLTLGHWAVATFGIVLALAIVAAVTLVVPLALTFVLAVPLLVLGLLCALLLSPLLLAGAIAWWLWRRSTRTTMPG